MPIKELNMYCRYNEGVFPNKNMRKLAKAVDILIKKTDEQTRYINWLEERIEILKQ